MRIAFVGAGAVGGYFGARMAAAGIDVSFLLRPDSARALKRRGLRVQSPLGDVEIARPKVTSDASTGFCPDVLFFACKAEHVRGAAEFARPAVKPETQVISLQNGVDAPQILLDVLGSGCVFGGLSRIFAERVAVGRIMHMGIRPSIAVGERHGGISARARRVTEFLAGVEGMVIDCSADIWSEMWKKLLMVCSLGAVGAVARAPLGVLLDVPEARALLEAAADEIAVVARANGATVEIDFARHQIARYRNLPSETTASMHRDLERGDPSELRDQLGAARRYGAAKDLPTPTLDALYGALLPGEMRARGEIDYSNVARRTAPETVSS
ncbi:MAG: 2-dehydropantoate 2-reductase [Bryobacterales bacterium]|nr:2-dehydropantoate 2-reductase [Bryobacterales bacterium]